MVTIITATHSNKPRRSGREGKSLEILVANSQFGVKLHQNHISAIRTADGWKELASPVDFFGFVVSPHRVVLLDCKQSNDTARFITSTTTLKEHQRLQLIDWGQLGAVAGLIAESTATSGIYFVPWWMILDRRPSIPWEELPFIQPSTRLIMASDWAKIVAANDARGGK